MQITEERRFTCVNIVIQPSNTRQDTHRGPSMSKIMFLQIFGTRKKYGLKISIDEEFVFIVQTMQSFDKKSRRAEMK